MKLALALSGGYIRGLAHIGALKFIDEEGLSIDFIAGTSAGSIVGAFYALGFKAQEIEEIAKAINWSDVVKYIIRSGFPRHGLINIKFLESIIEKHLGLALNFKELKIPLLITTVDISTGQAFFITEGDLNSAILASCAVPGIFTPVERDSLTLVDGGVLHNLPTNPLRDFGAEKIIAISIDNSIGLLSKPKNLIDVIFKTFTIMAKERESSHLELADYPIIIKPFDIGMWDLTKAQELIDLGYESAQKALASHLNFLKFL